MQVEIGGVYAHYKDPNSRYVVIDIGLLEATKEPAVIYRKDSVTWIRPLQSWLEMVDGKPRFKRVDG